VKKTDSNIGVISDYEFNAGTKSYGPKNAEFDGIIEIFYSEYLPEEGLVPSPWLS